MYNFLDIEENISIGHIGSLFDSSSFQVLDEAAKAIGPGVTTDELDR